MEYDYDAADPAQLSVKEGERVYVVERDPCGPEKRKIGQSVRSGWTLVKRRNPLGKREGWAKN